MILCSFAVITTAKCRLLYSSNLPATCDSHAELNRGSQSISAFHTTFYSAVPLPETHADADAFQTSLPRHGRHHHHHHCHHHHEVLDCFDVSSTTSPRDAHGDLSSDAVVGNGRCPAINLIEEDGQSRPRLRQRWRQSLAPRAAVLLRAVEDAFFPGSIVALLLTVAVVLCVDAIAVTLEGMARTLLNVDAVEALLERGIEDSANSINAFSDFVNAQLISPLCVDRVDVDFVKLTSLLHRRRVNVAGM